MSWFYKLLSKPIVNLENPLFGSVPSALRMILFLEIVVFRPAKSRFKMHNTIIS